MVACVSAVLVRTADQSILASKKVSTADSLLAVIVDHDVARVIGAHVLDMFQSRAAAISWVEARVEKLDELLRAGVQDGLSAALQEQRDTDLRRGHTFAIGGWILSHTEALPSVVFALGQEEAA